MKKFLDNVTANEIYSLRAEENQKKKKIIHYTSTEVLDILLDKCTFRASNIFYLNDAMEYKAGISSLRNLISEESIEVLKQINDENGSGRINQGVFTVSFSQEKDSLHQWITYAKETGVAIELDNDLITDLQHCLWYGIESYDKKEDKSKPYNELLYITLRVAMYPVVYEYSDYSRLQVDEMSENTKEKYMWYASFFKTSGFETEKEIRLSVFATKNELKKGEIKYYPMNGKGILRPYLDITFGYRSLHDKKKVFVPCLPIKSIMVGPSGVQQSAFNSIVHRVKYGKTNVYEYPKSRETLVKAFSNYLKEVFEWLNEKGYISDNDSIPTSMSITKNGNSLIDEILHYDNVESLIHRKFTGQAYDDLSYEMIVKQIISMWICDNKDYLLKFKDESGGSLYDESYLKEEREIGQCLDGIIQEVNNEFYFSKEGILIKKSKIPYIF